MNKRCINYRRIFKKPITIHSIGKFQLPVGIEMRRILIGLAIVFFLAIIHLTFLLGDFMKIPLVYLSYYGIPVYFGSDYLSEEQELFNGKTAFYFFVDFISYFFTIKLRKKKYINDEESVYLKEKITFEETRL